jgi:poly[(R)-3-hydroxyalkanoate] polymerase subunit PhaC
LSEPGADTGHLFVDLGSRVAQTLARLRLARDVQVGCSARRAVWSRHTTTLYEYLPLEDAPGAAGQAPRRGAGRSNARHTGRPLLICFALVNRPYILDLQPDSSLVRRLLGAGFNVYLVDWGDPGDGDRLRELNDYLEEGLGGCVRHILAAHRIDALDLLGVCQGGLFSLCYTALHPGQIANLVTLTTAVDYQTPDDLLSKWVREIDTALLARTGNLPGELLNALFLSLMPFRLMQQKYVRLLTGRPDQRAVEAFVRMERWIFDSPPQAAVALTQFVRWLYQENRLMRGTLELGGRVVDLKSIRQPLLNLYAKADHLVPPAACAVMSRYVGSTDYTACAIDTGHIGMYVSRKAREEIPERIISWLEAHSPRTRPRR